MAQQDQNDLTFDDLIPAAPAASRGMPAPAASAPAAPIAAPPRGNNLMTFQDLLPERPQPASWARTLQNSLAGFPDRMKRNIAGARAAMHSLGDMTGSLEFPEQSEPGEVLRMTEALRKGDPDTRFMVEMMGVSPDALMSDDAQTAIGARFALSQKMRNTRLANDEFLKARRGEIQTASRRLEANQPDYGIGPEGAAKRFAEAVMTGSLDMIPAIVTSFATGSPMTGAMVMGGQALGGSMAEGMEIPGLSTDEATARALLFSAAEFIPEYVPMKILTQGGGDRLLRMIKAAGAEGIQESLTEVIQSGSDWAAGVDEDMTWGEFVQNVLYSGAVGAGVGATLGAAVPSGAAPPSLNQRPGSPPANPPGVPPVATNPAAPAARGPIVAPDAGLDDVLAEARNRPVEFGDLGPGPEGGDAFMPAGKIPTLTDRVDIPTLTDRVDIPQEDPDSTQDRDLAPWDTGYPGANLDQPPAMEEAQELTPETVTDEDYPSLDTPPSTVINAEDRFADRQREALQDQAQEAYAAEDRSDQFENYRQWIEDASPETLKKSPGLLEQISMDTRLNDGESDVLEAAFKAKTSPEAEPKPEPVASLDQSPADLEAMFDEAANEVDAERATIDFADLETKTGDVIPANSAEAGNYGSIRVNSYVDEIDGEVKDAVEQFGAAPVIRADNELVIDQWDGGELKFEGFTDRGHRAWKDQDDGSWYVYDDTNKVLTFTAKTPAITRGPESSSAIDTIEAAANEAATSPENNLPEPSQAQIEAGNYKKGHVQVHGLNITIENPKGSTRSGKDPDGKDWSRELKSHYGYIKRTTGNDGEQIDVFVGNAPESEKVFVVDQLTAEGAFDEHKVMLGFNHKLSAHQGYKANYEKGWKVGPITEMTVPEFKAWLASEASKGPANPGYFNKEADTQEDPADAEQEPADAQAEAGLPAILTESKLKYIQRAIKEAGGRKMPPNQLETLKARVREEYEQEYNKALAGVTFEQYQKLNPGVTESINRQAYNQLREEFGLPEDTGKQVAAAEPEAELVDDENDAERIRAKTAGETPQRARLIAVADMLNTWIDDYSAPSDAGIVMQAINKALETGEGMAKLEVELPSILKEWARDDSEGNAEQLYALADQFADVIGLQQDPADEQEQLPAIDENKPIPEATLREWGEEIQAKFSTYEMRVAISEFTGQFDKDNVVRRKIRDWATELAKAGRYDLQVYITDKANDDPEYIRNLTTRIETSLQKTPNPKYSATVVQAGVHERATTHEAVIVAAKESPAAHRAELAERLLQEINKGLKDSDPDAVAAYQQLLVDGELDPGLFGAGYFDAAFGEAIRQIEKAEREAEKQARAARAQELLESLIKDSDPASVEPFTIGWNHAMAGGTRSNLPTSRVAEGHLVDLEAGYARGTEAIEELGSTKKRAKKMDRTGILLRRIQDSGSWDVQSTGEKALAEIERALNKMLKSISRSDVFDALFADGVTPGAKRAFESIRMDIQTPAKYVQDALTLFKPSYYMEHYTDSNVIMSYVVHGDRRSVGKSFMPYHLNEGWQSRLQEVEETLSRYVTEISEIAKLYDGARTVEDVAKALVTHKIGTKLEHPVTEYDYYIDLVKGFGGIYEMRESERKGPEKKLVRPRLDRVRREGLKDHRGGRNITLKELKDAFGFGDIHPGNYVTATQLQDHSNYAYDALMDFADVIGWNPKDLGFGGRLHLAFGALGKGRHAAHYQDRQQVLDEELKPTGEVVQVINLTNTQGDGALAHEYFHAIDYMNRRTFDAPGNSAQKTLMNMVVELMRWRPSTASIKSQIESFYYGTYWERSKRMGKTESARYMVKRMQGSISSLLNNGAFRTNDERYVANQTQYNKNAMELGPDYWGNRAEMLARAGEAWTYDQMAAKGAGNNYLVSNWVADGVTTKGSGYKGTPFPEGKDRAYINQLLDLTMKHLKVVDGLPTFTPDFLPEVQRVIVGPVLDEIDRVAATIPETDSDLQMVLGKEKTEKERASQAEVEAANLALLQQLQQDNLQGSPESLDGATMEDLEDVFEQAAAELEAEQQERTDADDRDGSTKLVDAILARGFATKMDWRELFTLADAAFGGTQGEGTYTPKDAYDAVEIALNREILRGYYVRSRDPIGTLDRLEALINNLPTQTKRTEEQDEFQQFSTPPTIGYLMAYAANPSLLDIMAEPSAGTGNLATIAAASTPKPQAMILNELSSRRADLLAGMPFGIQTKTHREDAAHLNDVLPKDEVPTVIIMNPPFSADGGKNKGKRTNTVGMNHVEQALARLDEGGRLVALVGQGLADNLPQAAAFWKQIKSRYTVRANIGLSGESYRKFGTTFDNQLLVIDKTGPTKGAILTDEFKGKDALENLKQAQSKLAEVANARVHPGERYTDQQGSKTVAGSGRFPGLPLLASTGGEGVGAAEGAKPGTGVDAGKRKGNAAGKRDEAGGRPGAGPESVRGDSAAAGTDVPAGTDGAGLTDLLRKAGDHGLSGASEALTGLYELFGGKSLKSFPGGMDEETYARAKPHFQKAWEQAKAAGRTMKEFFKSLIQLYGRAIKPYALRFARELEKLGESVTLTKPAQDTEAFHEIEQVARPDKPRELSDSVFDTYHPQVTLPGSMTHPGTLVESAAMSSVMAPPTTYVPNLPRSAVQKGALSDAQIEQVIRAGDAHSKILPNGQRKGYFMGDGTGLGKAREIVGVMLDNINSGRTKHVWISKDDTKLHAQALNDWQAVTGEDAKDLIHRLPDKSGDAIKAKDGILFLGYGKLRVPEKSQGEKKTRSRLDQIVEWLGPDFDGVIAFDESHKMANAVETKGKRGAVEVSATAKAGVELQNRLPNARILYVSATGATEVRNFGYATRLGLWGERTPFATVHDFIQKIASKGIAAMELVAQDMKALGVYLARSLSYHDVTYSMLRHDLTAEQIEMYDVMAEAWQIILKNVDAALAATGATTEDGRSKKGNNAKSAARAAFWGAHQAFFNQVMTAMQMPTLLADIEKQLAAGNAAVLQLVNTNEAQTERAAAAAAADDTPLEDLDITPRQMLIQFLENSFPVNKYETVTDPETGNAISKPVVDSEGNPVVSQEALALRNELIDRVSRIKIPLGALDQVLERFGTDAVAEVTGRGRRLVKGVWQKRGTNAVKADIADFMGDKKQIIIFSGAGGTGVDFHADLRVKNQRKRHHYLVQPGWRADEAVQGFGRSHRSNQKQAPHYVLMTTNIKGHLRFISSVARRLDQLGALTKGQRNTSQGMFSEEHNLETPYSHEALSGLIMDAALGRAGVPEGFTLSILEDEMGITLRDNEGNISKTKIPAVTSFLNRVLALKFERQNFVFNAFFERLQDVIQYHKDQGDFDGGIETLRAVSTKKLADQVVFTHETGAKARYVKLEIQRPVEVQTFADFMQMVANRKKLGELQFAKNKISGRVYGFVNAPDKTTKKGEVVPQKRRFGPTGNLTVEVEEVRGKYEQLGQQEAMELWNKEYEVAPKTKAHDVHIIAGTILPIYDRIAPSDAGDRLRVVRAQTDEGERIIGLRIDDEAVADTLKRLGAEQTFTATPEDVIRMVLKEDRRVTLANGWKLRRSRVSDENRIEITLGRDSYQWSYRLQPHGLIVERINYDNRYFIPSGNAKTMAYILNQSPIADIGSSKEDGPAFSVADPNLLRRPGAMRATDVRRAVAEITKGWQNGPKVVVIRGQHELPLEDFVHAQSLGFVNGYYRRDQGTIWLIADGIGSVEEATKVLRHEAIGHFAFEREFQSDLSRIFRGVLQLAKRDPQVAEVAARVAEEYRNEPAIVQASEIVARMAEQNIQASIMMRVRAAVRALLRRLGLPVEFTRDELVVMLRRAERSLRQGYRESAAQDRFEAAGKVKRRKAAASKASRSQPEFREDNPGGKWLEEERLRSEDAGTTRFGAPARFGATTGWFSQNLKLPVKKLSRVKGLRGEQSNVRHGDLAAIKKIMKDTGKLPLTESGREYAPFIQIGHDGRPWINEGNHRIMAAAELGISHIPVEVRYYSGGQDHAAPGWSPAELLADDAAESPAPTVSGSFSVKSPVAAEAAAPEDFFTVGEETWRDSFARVAQDKFQRIFRIRETIKGDFGADAVPEAMDPVLAEELMNGKVEEDLNKLWKKHVEPLVAAMKKASVTIEELGVYLMAKHAPDRNAHIARVNPDFGDAGSGMTDLQAEELIDKARAEGKLEELQELAKFVYAMNRERLKVIVESGLETPETVESWIEEFGEFYVPLKGGPNVKSGFLRTGQGFDVRGKESLTAFGRRTLADNPVYHTIAQFEETLVRREKAEVGKRLMRLARKYPNPRFWEVRYVGNAPWRRRLNPQTLEVEWIPDIHQFNNKEQYFGVKADGRQYYIKINDPLALRALHNMGPDRLNIVTKTLGRFNRFLAAVNTSLNPEFVISNFARDLETALYGIVAEQDLADGKIAGEALVGKILKDIPMAMRGAYRGLRDKDPANQEWQKWFQEYKESGAKIGFFGLKGVEQIEGEIKAALQKAGPGSVLQALGTGARGVKDWIDHVNGAVENAARLSAYVNARRIGISKDKAASLAKNLTVNFNRKGELGVFMNSLYLFYNASTQGTAQFLRVMKSNRARLLAGGIMAFGFILAELNRLMSGDDDDGEKYWDKIPDYEKERNLIIMKPGTDGEYWKFPLPYGYNIFFVAGTLSSSVMHGAQSVDEAALDLALTAAGSFNPIGMQDSEDPLKVTLKTLAPTLVQPFAQLAVNETFYGGPIYRENFPGGTQAPDSALGRDSTSDYYKAIAEFLNGVSGGSDYRPGSIDIHPESIEHLVNFVAGSAGANVDRSYRMLENTLQGQEVETRDIPFVRRLKGQAFDNEDVSTFYDRHDQLLQFDAEYKGLLETSRIEAARFRREHRQELLLVDRAKEVRSRLSDLYDERRRLEARNADVRLVNRRIERAVDLFNREYNRSAD